MFVRNNPKTELLKMYDKNPNLFREIGVSRDEIAGANRERLQEIVNMLRG